MQPNPNPTQVPGPCYADDYTGSRDPTSGQQQFFVGGYYAVARRQAERGTWCVCDEGDSRDGGGGGGGTCGSAGEGVGGASVLRGNAARKAQMQGQMQGSAPLRSV